MLNTDHEIKRTINFATRSGQITLATKVFGRGIDFVVVEDSVKKSGGLYVVQTFISNEQSESVQIEGRTARQGESGSFNLIVTNAQVRKLALDPIKLAKLGTEKILEEINTARVKRFALSYESCVAKAKQLEHTHKESIELMNYVKEIAKAKHH